MGLRQHTHLDVYPVEFHSTGADPGVCDTVESEQMACASTNKTTQRSSSAHKQERNTMTPLEIIGAAALAFWMIQILIPGL